MSPVNYFFKPLESVKADLERHSEKERQLLARIKEVADSPEGSFERAALQAYAACLAQLLKSKAELAAKVGKAPRR